MNLTLLRGAAVLAASAAILSTTATSANAVELTLNDGRGDVWVSSGEMERFTPAPESTHADITRIQFRHAARNIVVRAKFTELTRRGALVGIRTEMRTDEGVYRDVVLLATPPRRGGFFEIAGRRGSVECAATRSIDYVRNTMTATVPRSCLGDPRWVEFRVQNAWANPSFEQIFVDNPHNDRDISRTWTSRVLRG